MSEPKNPPYWRSPVPADVPTPEFTEGRELNFDTLRYRVFRRARIYLDAECFENGRTFSRKCWANRSTSHMGLRHMATYSLLRINGNETHQRRGRGFGEENGRVRG